MAQQIRAMGYSFNQPGRFEMRQRVDSNVVIAIIVVGVELIV